MIPWFILIGVVLSLLSVGVGFLAVRMYEEMFDD